MVWRLIIRGIGIALLTLCVAAWEESYFEYRDVAYGSKTAVWAVGLERGEFAIAYYRATFIRGWQVRHWRFDAVHLAEMQTGYKSTPYHALGFAWQWNTATELWLLVMIPLWFPTTVATGLLWLVWRKTRPQFSAKGFPVEVAPNAPSNSVSSKAALPSPPTTSPNSLYQPKFASFPVGAENDAKDAIGFIKLFGLPMKVHAAVIWRKNGDLRP